MILNKHVSHRIIENYYNSMPNEDYMTFATHEKAEIWMNTHILGDAFILKLLGSGLITHCKDWPRSRGVQGENLLSVQRVRKTYLKATYLMVST